MSVLTRDEAQTRARLLDVHRYTIALDLTTGDETFESRTVVRFTARAEADTFVELKPAELRRPPSTAAPSTRKPSRTTGCPSRA